MSRSRATSCATTALSLPVVALVLVVLVIAYASLSGRWQERTELRDQADAVADQLDQSAPPVTLQDVWRALDGASEKGQLVYYGHIYRVGPVQSGGQELLVMYEVPAHSNWLISGGWARGCFRYLLHEGDAPAVEPVEETSCYSAAPEGPLNWP